MDCTASSKLGNKKNQTDMRQFYPVVRTSLQQVETVDEPLDPEPSRPCCVVKDATPPMRSIISPFRDLSASFDRTLHQLL